MTKKKPEGWPGEPGRHRLAAKGVRTVVEVQLPLSDREDFNREIVLWRKFHPKWYIEVEEHIQYGLADKGKDK